MAVASLGPCEREVLSAVAGFATRLDAGVGRRMKTVIALLGILMSNPAFAVEPYRVQNLMLLQPDSVLSERVQVQALSHYIASVNSAAQTSLAGAAQPTPSAGFIVVAVRPGGRSKVWLDFSPALPLDVATQLRSSLERVAPFEAKNGVVVFAINSTLWGAAATERQGPSPIEWQEAMKDRESAVMIDDLVDHVWPSDAHD